MITFGCTMHHKILPLIICLFFCSCNNWQNNPTAAIEIKSDLIPGLVYKASFPEKTSAILFASNDFWITGTMDGKLYKSVDEGKTWIQKGALAAPDSVKSINVIEYTFNAPKKTYLYLASSNGIYVSSDKGESWYTGSVNNGTGANPVINVFYYSYDSKLVKDIITAYGWDGKNNTFKTTDNGHTWEPSITGSGNISAYLGVGATKSGHGYYVNFIASSISYHAYIVTNRGDSLSFGRGNFIYGIINTQHDLLYANTKEGLYWVGGEDIVDNDWVKIGLSGFDVRSLSFVTITNIYAGTDKGLFYSTNSGISWKKLYFGSEEISVRAIANYNNVLYFLNDKGEVSYSLITEGLECTIFPPMLIHPLDGNTGVPVNTSLEWSEWQSKKENFIIQISEDKLFIDDKTKTIDFLRDTKYFAQNLKSGTKYYWHVKANNLYGSSDWSTPFSFTTQ
jgi:hypothetical protein